MVCRVIDTQPWKVYPGHTGGMNKKIYPPIMNLIGVDPPGTR
jgi:hypothetical protein